MATKTKTSAAVTTKDMADVPSNYFMTLDLPTLHTVADYFGAEQEESIEEQVLALAEMGITYKLYAQAFKVPLPDGYTDEDETLKEEPVTEQAEGGLVLGDRNPALAPQAEYLIKMTRANPYFEVGKYKFTQANPYNIMDAASAQYVLQQEEGFRQAFPDELRDFYQD